MTRDAALWLSLVALAAAAPACSASNTSEPAAGSTVAEPVAEGTKAVSQGPSDASAQMARAGKPTPPSPGARTGRRTPSSAAESRSLAQAATFPSAVSPQDAVHAEGAEPDVALGEPVSRESVHQAPPVLAATPASQTAPASAAPRLVRSDRIYSDQDPDVTPAVLLTTKEAGPIFHGVQGPVNTMELVISREGRVETVRLLTPATRMTDMLLLSGAKTWKFAPALKEGQPVRYRTRFSWEATP